MTVSIVWFRLDLRLSDNQALLGALAATDQVVPVYIWSPEEEGAAAPGAASRWWLHESLKQLSKSLRRCGAQLIIRQGPALPAMLNLIEQTGAQIIFFNRRYDPDGIKSDSALKTELAERGIEVRTFNSNLLLEPSQLHNRQGDPYRVFTPFWNQLKSTFTPGIPEKTPEIINFPAEAIDSLPLESLGLEPQINWHEGISACWNPGETTAHTSLKRFVNSTLKDYGIARDRPDQDGVSLMSPHLHFGEIGPRQIWQAVKTMHVQPAFDTGIDAYLKELGWREFAYYTLFHFPHTSANPMREQFNQFPWSDEPELLELWKKGLTGYPIIDAGMRQLWNTGWMHNRIRMIVASFLTKDLLISWTQGASWFWDTLVDADIANNIMGWQWSAGCGADAQPYFRIFNPQLQGEKFDPHGDYVRHWVPELALLPAKWIHKPDKAPIEILRNANIKLGHNYPKPIVDHALARGRALDALAQITLKK